MQASSRFQAQDQVFSKNVQGLTDLEGAKAVARRIMDTYGRSSKGQISSVDCVPMIVEAYRSFNQQFSPSNQDIQSYYKVLDRNGDGRVDYTDIEELCIRYLCPGQYQPPEPKQEQPRQEKVKRNKFTPEVEARLDVARRLFKKFDTDNTGYIEENEVAGVLKETYAQMGMNYNPSADDVKIWMDMTDENRDGKVTLEEYEAVVIRSLQKAGFKIEQQTITF